MIDAFRDEPRNAPARFFPARPERRGLHATRGNANSHLDVPAPDGDGVRKKLTQTFTQVVLRILNVPQVD